MIPSAPFDTPPPPKPKPDEEHEPFEPGNDIGPWRILLPILSFVLLDAYLVASTKGWVPYLLQMVNDPPMRAAIFASQSLLVAMMYYGSAPTMVRSLRHALGGPNRFATWGVIVVCAALLVPVLGVLPELGIALIGGVFVGLALDLLGFGLRPYEEVPAISRRFSLKSMFASIALVAVLLVGFRYTVSEIDRGNINVFRITLALFLVLAALALAALAAMWSWPMWLASAAVSIVAVNILIRHNDMPGAAVATVVSFALAISAANAVPLLLAGWRVYRKPYYG